MKISIYVPLLAPSLNGSKGLMRMHWAAYGKVRDRWALMVKISLSECAWGVRRAGLRLPVRKCEVSIERHYSNLPLDLDNLYAASKIPLDSLRKAGVVVDDDPSVVTALNCTQHKVSKRSEQQTIITLTIMLTDE